jgi:hypothetical protein
MYAEIDNNGRHSRPLPFIDYSPPHGIGVPGRNGNVIPMARVSHGIAPALKPFNLISLSDLAQSPPVEWIVPGVLRLDGVACLYGPPGAGKSLLALDWALSIAAGTAWHGHEVARGNVLYVAAEGSKAGLSARVQAWLADRRVDLRDVEPAFIMLHGPVDLSRQGEGDRLIEQLVTSGLAYRLIVIDTLSACLGDADENSRDLVRFLVAVDSIRRATSDGAGSTALIIHHSGKDGSIRGFSGLPGYVEQTLRLTGRGKASRLTCEKNRDGEPIGTVNLAIREVGESVVFDTAANRPPAAITRLAPDVLLVLGAIVDARDGVAPKTICEGTGFQRKQVTRIIKLLRNSQFIEHNGKAGTSAVLYLPTQKGITAVNE